MIQMVDLVEINPDVRIAADQQRLSTPKAQPAGFEQRKFKDFCCFGNAYFFFSDCTESKLFKKMSFLGCKSGTLIFP